MNPDEYVAEPYVTPGNIEGPDSPFFGRGGWTWYSGSAAWLFKVGTGMDPRRPSHTRWPARRSVHPALMEGILRASDVPGRCLQYRGEESPWRRWGRCRSEGRRGCSPSVDGRPANLLPVSLRPRNMTSASFSGGRPDGETNPRPSRSFGALALLGLAAVPTPASAQIARMTSSSTAPAYVLQFLLAGSEPLQRSDQRPQLLLVPLQYRVRRVWAQRDLHRRRSWLGVARGRPGSRDDNARTLWNGPAGDGGDGLHRDTRGSTTTSSI